MTITWKSSTNERRTGLSASLRLVTSALAAMLRAMRNRRAVLQVADLSDAHLSDIGLRRDDVHQALQTGWREDPSYGLAVAASRRRRLL